MHSEMDSSLFDLRFSAPCGANCQDGDLWDFLQTPALPKATLQTLPEGYCAGVFRKWRFSFNFFNMALE